MPKNYRSPLSDSDLAVLETLATKAIAYTQGHQYAPFYAAIEVGDLHHQNGYLLLCWPALNIRSAHCARLIFDYMGDVVKAEFGASIVATVAQKDPDAPRR